MPGDGRVDPQAAGPGAEPALPAADQDAAVALVAGDALGRPAVEHAEPAPAYPADRQALQQRAAFPGRAGAVPAAGGGHVRGQARGVGQVGVPADVAGMMVNEQHLPVLGAGHHTPAAGRGAAGVNVAFAAGTAVDVAARVGGVGQDLVHRRVGGRGPGQPPVPGRGQLQAVLAQPQPDLAGRPAGGEPVEHRADRAADCLIGVRQDLPGCLAPDQPGRQRDAQFPAGGLVPQPAANS